MKTFRTTFSTPAVWIISLVALASFFLLEASAAYLPNSRWETLFGSVVTAQDSTNGDDRKDFYEVNDELKTDANKVAILVMEAVIDEEKLKTKKLSKTHDGLCSDEPFREQPIIYHKSKEKGWVCSGFLIAPDVIATAGHCIDMPEVKDSADKKRLKSLRFVFGYRMQSSDSAVIDAEKSQIYKGKRFIGSSEKADWALIQLDRPVANREPVMIAIEPLASGQAIHVVGHPYGLPLKIAANATVQPDFTDTYFKANLDVFSGNSGSPVFNASHQVVGILMKSFAGNFPLDPVKKCRVSKMCSSGVCAHSQVTRTAVFANCLAGFDSPNCQEDLKCQEGFDWD